MMARAWGAKVLLHPHCSFVELYMGRHRLWQWYVRRVIALSNGLIALSQEWLRVQEIAPQCEVYFLPNAIDLTPYKGIAASRQPLSNGRLRILYLGYIGESKGSFDLVEAAKLVLAQYSDVIFELVGEALTPWTLAAMKALIQRYEIGSWLRLCAPEFGGDKEKRLQNADIFVYPSHNEGMPIAIIEAMACGLPIVATRVGGIPDLITHGVNGFLVSKGHPGQLADAILKLCKNRELRLRMGCENMKRAYSQHGIEQYVDRLIELYYRILRRST